MVSPGFTPGFKLKKQILLLLISLYLIILGCGSKSSDSGSTTPNQLIRGFGISPQGFPLDYSKTNEFLAEVQSLSRGAVMWNGSWRDDAINGTDAGNIPQAAGLIAQNAASYHYTPVAVFGWRSDTTLLIKVPADSTNNWTNTAAKDLFKSMLANYASLYHPPFIFLGDENDFYYEQNSADYANWIIFYKAAYAAIKFASPETKVGPIFNLEHMAGTGALNGWSSTYWGAIDTHDFNYIDVVGLTVYPWLNYPSASSVETTYLDKVLAHTGGKPLVITETGWPAENLGGLNPIWETSETAQVTYLSRLKTTLAGKNVLLVNWLYLNPMADPGGSPISWKMFGSISVKNSSGIKRAVYNDWKDFQ